MLLCKVFPASVMEMKRVQKSELNGKRAIKAVRNYSETSE